MLRLIALTAVTAEFAAFVALGTVGVQGSSSTDTLGPRGLRLLAEQLLFIAWPGIPAVVAILGLLRREAAWTAFGAPTPALFGIWWIGPFPLPSSTWSILAARIAGGLLLGLAVIVCLAAIQIARASEQRERSVSALTVLRDVARAVAALAVPLIYLVPRLDAAAPASVRLGIWQGYGFTVVWLIVIFVYVFVEVFTRIG